jgi:hypothetical protein
MVYHGLQIRQINFDRSIPPDTDASTKSPFFNCISHSTLTAPDPSTATATRISKTIHQFHQSGIISEAPRISRPRKWRSYPLHRDESFWGIDEWDDELGGR